MAASSIERPYLHAGFGTPERQNRWSVAFRLILAIPHFVVLVALGIASYVILLIGWVAALFMGRIPRWAATYLRGYIVYATRVYAYFWLMLDDYPPFSLEPGSDYPVNLDVPYGRVRRLAVLFRFILVIPAEIVLALVVNGLQVILVFVWLIVLVAGRMPVTLFSAVAAILRYEARFYAYFAMLTGKYPGELFGDPPVMGYPQPLAPTTSPVAAWVPGAPAVPPPVPPYPGEAPPAAPAMPAPTEPAPPAMPLSGQPAPPAMPPGPPSMPPPSTPAVSPPGMPAVPPPGMPAVSPPGMPSMPPGEAPPRTARLVLGRGAKRLLVVLIVLGVLEYVGLIVLAATFSSANVGAFNSLVEAHNTLSAAISSAQGQLQACGANSLSCNETYQGQLATDFQDFGNQLPTIAFPSSVQGRVSSLESDTRQLVSLLQQMSTAPDATAYESEFSQAESLGNRFDSDYTSLANALL